MSLKSFFIEAARFDGFSKKWKKPDDGISGAVLGWNDKKNRLYGYDIQKLSTSFNFSKFDNEETAKKFLDSVTECDRNVCGGVEVVGFYIFCKSTELKQIEMKLNVIFKQNNFGFLKNINELIMFYQFTDKDQERAIIYNHADKSYLPIDIKYSSPLESLLNVSSSFEVNRFFDVDSSKVGSITEALLAENFKQISKGFEAAETVPVVINKSLFINEAESLENVLNKDQNALQVTFFSQRNPMNSLAVLSTINDQTRLRIYIKGNLVSRSLINKKCSVAEAKRIILDDLDRSWRIRTQRGDPKFFKKIEYGLQNSLGEYIVPLKRRVFFQLDNSLLFSGHLNQETEAVEYQMEAERIFSFDKFILKEEESQNKEAVKKFLELESKIKLPDSPKLKELNPEKKSSPEIEIEEEKRNQETDAKKKQKEEIKADEIKPNEVRERSTRPRESQPSSNLDDKKENVVEAENNLNETKKNILIFGGIILLLVLFRVVLSLA